MLFIACCRVLAKIRSAVIRMRLPSPRQTPPTPSPRLADNLMPFFHALDLTLLRSDRVWHISGEGSWREMGDRPAGRVEDGVQRSERGKSIWREEALLSVGEEVHLLGALVDFVANFRTPETLQLNPACSSSISASGQVGRPVEASPPLTSFSHLRLSPLHHMKQARRSPTLLTTSPPEAVSLSHY